MALQKRRMITLCSLLVIIAAGASATPIVSLPLVFRGHRNGAVLAGGPEVSPDAFTLEVVVEFEAGQQNSVEVIGELLRVVGERQVS